MKIIALTSVFALSLMTTSAFACDMHGGGGFHSGFGMNWQSYKPTSSYDDSGVNQYSSTSGDTQVSKELPTVKKRPSFSNAAKTASARAQLKLASASISSAGQNNVIEDDSVSEDTPVISDADMFDPENLKLP